MGERLASCTLIFLAAFGHLSGGQRIGFSCPVLEVLQVWKVGEKRADLGLTIFRDLL